MMTTRVVAVLFGLCVWIHSLPAQTNVANLPNLRLTREGVVRAVEVQADGKIIIGGEFQWINNIVRSNLARLLPDGTVDLSWNPPVNDAVHVMWLDGTNLYVGGHFTAIGSDARTYLARISTTGTGGADTNWTADTDGPVRVLVPDEDHLFVGGSFSNINGVMRTNVARVSIADGGTIDPTWAAAPDASVKAIALTDDAVLVGGQFTNVSGIPRTFVAKLDRATGAVDPDWAPEVEGSVFNEATPDRSTITSIAVSGTDVFLGGGFANVGGRSLRGLAKVGLASTGAVDTVWGPYTATFGATYLVNTVKVFGTNVYAGGNFGSTISLARFGVEGSGAEDPAWAFRVAAPPSIGAETMSVYLEGTNALVGYIGGTRFISVETGTREPNLVPELRGTGLILHALKLPDDSTVLAGRFSRVNNEVRINALKLTPSGELDPLWTPQGVITTEALETDGTNIYFGGFFNSFGGLSRTNLARIPIESATGAVDTNWTSHVVRFSSAGARVSALKWSDGWLYVGGTFDTINGNYVYGGLARVSAADGNPHSLWLPWQTIFLPPPSTVGSIAVTSNMVYFGGSFQHSSTVRYLSRAAKAGTVTSFSWSSGIDRPPDSLVANEQGVFIGGSFTSILGVAQARLAKIELVTTNLDTNWSPSLDRNVMGMTLDGTNLYVAGLFQQINGFPASGVARLSATGSAQVDTNWLPDLAGAGFRNSGWEGIGSLASYPTNRLSGAIGERLTGGRAIVPLGNDVLVAGNFLAAQGEPRDGIVWFTSNAPVFETYSTWSTNYFSSAELGDTNISGIFADADGDSGTNLLEFALNLNPTNADNAAMISESGTNGVPIVRWVSIGTEHRLAIEYVRRPASLRPGIRYVPEFADSVDGPWIAGGVENVIYLSQGWERVVTLDASPSTVGFLRLVRLRVVPPE